MKTQLVVDGNSILNRAYYGVRPLTNKDGLHTNALFGFASTLLKHLGDLKPDYITVAFDLPAPTFRHKAYDGYKANRHGMPAELAEQLPYAKRCVAAMGMTVVECEGWEADDVLGTMAALGNQASVMTYILTGDRDALQLINDRVHVLLAANTETTEIDRQSIFDKYGIEPRQLVEIKALMGDASDNIPGVAGIGEKTARTLILKFGSVDCVYRNLNIAGTPMVRRKLEEGRESAMLSLSLADIKTNAPVGVTLEDTVWRGFSKGELLVLFRELGFTTFIRRMNLDRSSLNDRERQRIEEQPISIAELTRIPEAAIVLDEHVAHLYDGKDYYSCTYARCADLRSFAEQSGLRLRVSDLKKMCSVLQKDGVSLNADCYDVLLAGYLLNPSEGVPECAELAASYLGVGVTGSAGLAEAIWRLRETTEALLEKNGMLQLYREIELPLARVLSDMELTGFKVDTAVLRAFSERLEADIQRLTDEIYAMSGEVFNINSPKQLGEVLFVKMGLAPPRRVKNGYATGAEVLEKLRDKHPIIDKIFEYRQATKFKSTYADGLLKAADENGRVHTTFNQMVTSTGRLSSTDPNLQNIPIRTERGREFRRCFVASDSDHVLIDADYSQIELRLLAHMSGDERLIAAFKADEDIHTRTASEVFGVAPEEVTPEMRKRAKAVNFGIVYGISDYSLGVDLDVSRYEAGEYIRQYLARYPAVESYMNDIKATAKQLGYVCTLFGRRRYIPELSASKAATRAFGERVAMNSPIQGSAADIIKLAMVRTHRALRESNLDAHLILQVHDELIVEASRQDAAAAAEILRREMENVVQLSVPLSVDLRIGDTWMEGH